jgi:hypothetical protein
VAPFFDDNVALSVDWTSGPYAVRTWIDENSTYAAGETGPFPRPSSRGLQITCARLKIRRQVNLLV